MLLLTLGIATVLLRDEIYFFVPPPFLLFFLLCWNSHSMRMGISKETA